ncbi:MAG: DNA mismatch repair endonuclease MutL [Saprospiraceae bacterium]
MSELIRLLPDGVVNQIAAGEVIQRPSSVVKELMDNALDSGASELKLLVKEAGKELIQLVDNGCGMSPVDARMSFERHATSKIRTSEDLFRIQTLGFRGEALASIAAVSRVEMRTKRHEDEAGTRILIQDSKIMKQEACACLNGTQIQVSDLFYSVPARKKFLKSDAVELRHIQEEFIAQAISHPEVAMSFIQGEAEIFKCRPEGLKQRIGNIYGKKYLENLMEINHETEVVHISGFVGSVELMKKSKSEQLLYINRRLIKSNYLNHAITSAYEEVLATHAYPFYVLFLQIDPSNIDINVHPTKHEIKFEDERLIYNFLKVAIKQVLGNQILALQFDFENENPGISKIFSNESRSMRMPIDKQNMNAGSGSMVNWKQLAFPSAPKEIISQREQEIFKNEPIAKPELQDFFGEEKASEIEVYQIFSAYIMYVSKAGLTFIDQQSAHERILYEYYMKSMEDQTISSQRLLFPQTIHLNKTDGQILNELLELLHNIGIEVESFGSDSYIIQKMPNILDGKFNEKELLTQIIEQYKLNMEFEFSPIENIARSMAKSTSIKRGKILAKEEMLKIVEQLYLCLNPNISPAGKKCIHLIKQDEFIKIFNN